MPYPEVTFELRIKRRLLYYMYHVVYPCVMMSVLTLLEFSLPPESGEKISLGITILLAFSVLTLAIAEALPETSDSIPLISVYLLLVMTLSSLSIILTVIVLNIHHCSYNTPPLPASLRRFIVKNSPNEASASAWSELTSWRRCRKIAAAQRFHSSSPQMLLCNGVSGVPKAASPRRESADLTPSHCSVAFVPVRTDVQVTVTQKSRSSGSQLPDERKRRKLPPKLLRFASKDGANFLNSAHCSPVFMSPNANKLPCSGANGRALVNDQSVQTECPCDERLQVPTSLKGLQLPLLYGLCRENGFGDNSSEVLQMRIAKLLEKEKQDEEILHRHREWQEFARYVDRMLFWIFVCVTVVLTFVALIFIPLLSLALS